MYLLIIVLLVGPGMLPPQIFRAQSEAECLVDLARTVQVIETIKRTNPQINSYVAACVRVEAVDT